MKPALPAICGGTRVPGKRQRLQAASGEIDEVLLQRLYAEHVGDLVFAILPRRIGRCNVEAVVAPEEACRFAIVVEAGVVEIPEHGIGGGDLHRELVMRAEPVVVL